MDQRSEEGFHFINILFHLSSEDIPQAGGH